MEVNYSILVTGANGQLGSEFKALSKHSKHAFYFTDHSELDITNENSVNTFFSSNNIDICINCAAYTAVDKAEDNYIDAFKINVNGVENLAKACNLHKVFLFHISTDFVFGGNQNYPLKEDDKTQPTGVYAETKLQGENRVAAMLEHYIILRTSWLYSSYGHNFVKIMLRLGKERQSINVVFDQIGTPTYAADLAKAILHITEQGLNKTRLNSGIYHYSNEGAATWFDFASEIMELANFNCKVYPIETSEYPTPAKRPHYSVLNKQLIKSTFGIDIPYWRESLKHCLQKIKNNAQ